MAHFIGVNEKTGEKSASGMASLADATVGQDAQATDGKSKDAIPATDGGSKDAALGERRSFGIVTK